MNAFFSAIKGLGTCELIEVEAVVWLPTNIFEVKGTDVKLLYISINNISPLGILFGTSDMVNWVVLSTLVTVCVPV